MTPLEIALGQILAAHRGGQGVLAQILMPSLIRPRSRGERISFARIGG
jgi:hypothetical protein